MQSISVDQPSELASNLLLAAFSLALFAGYFVLFQLFREDRQQSQVAPLEQQIVGSSFGSPSYGYDK